MTGTAHASIAHRCEANGFACPTVTGIMPMFAAFVVQVDFAPKAEANDWDEDD